MRINTNEKKAEIFDTLKKFSTTFDLQALGDQYDKHFKGYGNKATIENIYAFILGVLYEYKLVTAVDWKWQIQDELGRIKLAEPEFNYEIKDLKQSDDFEVSCTLLVNGKSYEFENCTEYDFFSKMNEVLEDIKSTKCFLIIEGHTGDTLLYCVVQQEHYSELATSIYLPFACA